ncbi:Arylsulfatase A [Flavobacterium flevense]|uniref:Sulfatase n=1 Tax=Flavobacterium flevense TaxID=983 RepID=A0A4Y4B281_9FLAO|nr:sulfatase [Flavobacterium flevense]GEC72773.1 sulfatase [Flavobacterium flevense]SHM16634.1 Arylsulfatase A [Flavobacterium flevense]
MITKKTVLSLLVTSAITLSFPCKASEKKPTDKPNILFLVIEDTSPYLFPKYGNKSIKTPNIDWLADNGVVFDNAFANAPYCSPARSTLISGTQATVYGNDLHREGHIQKEQYFLVKKLTDAGYFTVNKGKTDYNITGKDTKKFMNQAWSMNEGNATYNDETRGNKPFFGQFNNNTTHMSRMTTVTIDKRLKCKVDPLKVELPPHVPDLPEVRADYALHLEGVQDIDAWVGVFLDDLRKRKILDNTIIFFFSDHGGCLPRGKAFPFDTGHRVPLVVYTPKKYEHLLPAKKGAHTDRMVSFDDFIPTAMSIAGIDKPNYITGKPFMGKFKEAPRQYIHTFRSNSENHYDASRGVFNGRYHYIKYYTPNRIHALTQSFQWQMPAQLAWDEYFMQGNANEQHSVYYTPHPKEALFDLKNDPWEAKNLALDPEFKEKIEALRAVNASYVRNIKDLGFLSWEERTALTKQGKDFYTWVRETNYPLNDLISLAEIASEGNIDNLPLLIKHLDNNSPSFKFWAVSGVLTLVQQNKLEKAPAEVLPLMTAQEYKDVSVLAAEIIVRTGNETEGLNFLLKELKNGNPFAFSCLENLWEKNVPIKEQLLELAKNGKSKGLRLEARSLLIKLGELNIEQLYEQDQIDAGYKTYFNRVKEYIQNTP